MTRLPRTLMTSIAIAGFCLALTSCQGDSRREAVAAEAPGSVVTADVPDASQPAPQVVGYGEPVDIREYMVPGQITLFDFMSEYCGPCRMFAPYLERLHHERDDLTVVKVDINRRGKRGIDWGSPVARQYGVRSVPHFKVYDAQGNLMAEGPAAQPLVISWIEELPDPRRAGR